MTNTNPVTRSIETKDTDEARSQVTSWKCRDIPAGRAPRRAVSPGPRGYRLVARSA